MKNLFTHDDNEPDVHLTIDWRLHTVTYSPCKTHRCNRSITHMSVASIRRELVAGALCGWTLINLTRFNINRGVPTVRWIPA